MRRLFVACVLICTLLPTISPSSTVAASYSCADYDSWEWAQTIYDTYASSHSALDPDGNGIACDELPHGGFAPAHWTDTIPANVVEAQLTGVTDGDTLSVTINGQPDTVRLYRADSPEVVACGGVSATNFTRNALALNDAGSTIYLESDATDRDRYDRKLAYVWWKIDGHPYMLNEVLMRSGWARDVDYGDRLHNNDIAGATKFAEDHQLGAWAECGGFSADAAAGSGDTAPVPQTGPGAGTCDPSYPSVCIPPIEVTGDLDCGQIAFTQFKVLPPDPHGFDSDHDGIGCEGKK